MKDQGWILDMLHMWFCNTHKVSNIWAAQDKNEIGTDRKCMEMLIPSIPKATVDKQRIIRDLKRNRGTVSLALHSVSHVRKIKRARPTITPSAQGNKSQLLLLLMLLSTVNWRRQKRKKGSKRKLKMLNWPTGSLKLRGRMRICVW